MAEEIIKKKIELVRLKRAAFIRKNFPINEDLMIRKFYHYNTEPSLIFPSFVDNYIIKLLKIKKKDEKELCKQIRIDYKPRFEKTKGDYVYGGITTNINGKRKDVTDFSYERWDVIERYLRAYIDNKDALCEIDRKRKEEERKVELCRLTKCYDEKVGTALCDCGWVNRAEAKYCAECGVSLI